MADFQQFKLKYTSEAWLGEIVLPVFLRSGNKAHWRCIFLSSTHGSQLWNLRVYVGVEESHGGFRERDDFESTICGVSFLYFFLTSLFHRKIIVLKITECSSGMCDGTSRATTNESKSPQFSWICVQCEPPLHDPSFASLEGKRYFFDRRKKAG